MFLQIGSGKFALLLFIASTHIIQDLPFGEKTLKLSSNTEIKVRNVVRSLISEHIVLQYLNYCSDVDFVPRSRSTQLKVFSLCFASWRKSLQGWTVSVAGAKAFDKLGVIDMLGGIMEKVSHGPRCRKRNFI